LIPLICGKNGFFYNESFHLGAMYFYSILKKART